MKTWWCSGSKFSIEIVSLHYLETVTQIEVFHVNTALVLTNFVFTKNNKIIQKILHLLLVAFYFWQFFILKQTL